MKNRTFERFFKSSSSFVSIFFFKGAEFRDTVEREELKKCLKFSVSSWYKLKNTEKICSHYKILENYENQEKKVALVICIQEFTI